MSEFREVIAQFMLHGLMLCVCVLALIDMTVSKGFYAFVWWVFSGVVVTMFLNSAYNTLKRLVTA